MLMMTNIKNKGASLIELAIAIPVIFLIVLGLVDIAVYYTAQGVAVSAASRAAYLASYTPDLDSADLVERTAAIAEVRQEAYDYAVNALFRNGTGSSYLRLNIPLDHEVFSFLGDAGYPSFNADGLNSSSPVNLFFPMDPASPDLNNNKNALREAMLERPVEIQVHAEVDSIWLGYLFGSGDKFEIVEKVYAYRQPTNEPAYPTPIDCGGDAAAFLSGECSCGAGKAYDPLANECICKPGLIDVLGACECPAGFTPGPNDTCLCDLDCDDNQSINYETCECVADGCNDFGANRVLNSETGICQCDPEICGDDGIFLNPNDCDSCQPCGANTVRDIDASECICQLSEDDCGEFEDFLEEECRCACNSTNINFSRNACENRGPQFYLNVTGDERCTCTECASPFVTSADKTNCECDLDALFAICDGQGDAIRPSDCTCQGHSCTGNFVPQSNNRYLNGGSPTDSVACICPAAVEDDCDGDFDAATCTCTPCEAGKESVAASCLCENRATGPTDCIATGQKYNSLSCECQPCPVGERVADSGTACIACLNEEEVTPDGLSCSCPVADGVSACSALPFHHFDEASCRCVNCATTAGKAFAECQCNDAARDLCSEIGDIWDDLNCICNSVRCEDNPTAAGCSCNQELVSQESCSAIDPRLYFNPDTCKCELCDDDNPYFIQQGAPSFCTCDLSSVNCLDQGPNFVKVFGSECGCQECPTNYVRTGEDTCGCDTANVQATCNANNQPFLAGSCSCGVECGVGQVLSGDGEACECSSDEAACDGVFDPITCSCTPCDPGKIEDNNSCVCETVLSCSIPGQVFSPDSCSCEDCPADSVPNGTRDACVPCGANYSPDPGDADSCICDIDCGATARRVTASCTCEACPSGRIANSTDPEAACVCPPIADCDLMNTDDCSCLDNRGCDNTSYYQAVAGCCADGETFESSGFEYGGYCAPGPSCQDCYVDPGITQECITSNNTLDKCKRTTKENSN